MREEVYLLTLLNFLIFKFKFCDFAVTKKFDHKYKWRGSENVYKIKCRLLATMKSHFEQAEGRIDYIKHMRFLYEESPHYEMGYVVGEIIERYRKAVEAVKHVNYWEEHLTSKYYRMEWMQKLYLEVYHLVQMMNEVPRKYEYQPEFKDILKTLAAGELERIQKQWAVAMKFERKKAEKFAKRKKKITEIMASFQEKASKNRESPTNENWPRDYGWEIPGDTVRWPTNEKSWNFWSIDYGER